MGKSLSWAVLCCQLWYPGQCQAGCRDWPCCCLAGDEVMQAWLMFHDLLSVLPAPQRPSWHPERRPDPKPSGRPGLHAPVC